mmetsp:Transcript_16913/g.23211  ORF Transcript_16913/g.23211 Transcript_16913/m.23211 type:complete len:82 (-) Transcript_16913:548-793(-)
MPNWGYRLNKSRRPRYTISFSEDSVVFHHDVKMPKNRLQPATTIGHPSLSVKDALPYMAAVFCWTKIQSMVFLAVRETSPE